MNIFPAIDIIDSKAVRLLKGDYNKKTVYNDEPLNVVKDFKKAGAQYLHLVDLDGAKSGNTDNIDTVKKIVNEGGLFVEVGGGIRNIETVDKYFDIGVNRVIIGTAAVTNQDFLVKALEKYDDKIADLYRQLALRYKMNITASGGVSSISDIENLRKLDLYGAIIGKAYYSGAINLSEAIKVAK